MQLEKRIKGLEQDLLYRKLTREKKRDDKVF